MRHSASMSLLISPVQSGGKFTDDGTFFKETWLVSMIYFKSVTQGVKDVKSSVVQIMLWCRAGDKTLPKAMNIQFTDAYMRHYGDGVYTMEPRGNGHHFVDGNIFLILNVCVFYETCCS